VSDTGPGIPPEIEGRLFQSFVTAGKADGTGLGLAIVKKIAEEHGGTVSVHSTSRGATFEMRIPQPANAAPQTVATDRLTPTGDARDREPPPTKPKPSKRRRPARKASAPKSPQ
jgi:hypothetical protein